MLQGRVFIGGEGIEATDVDGEAALDDTTPTWLLRAPDSGVIVVPLYVRLQLTSEGGAAPDAYLTLINSNLDDPIVYTSGTAGTVLNALGGQSRTNQAKFVNTVTIAAVTDAQNAVIWQAKDIPDNLLSAEAVGTGTPVETLSNSMSAVSIPLFPHIPIALTKGGMLAFYTATGTSDSKYRPTFVWAEIPDDIL
ncbi:MAG: hypothetical protein WC359_14040 [Dehalococcoidia bacterium]